MKIIKKSFIGLKHIIMRNNKKFLNYKILYGENLHRKMNLGYRGKIKKLVHDINAQYGKKLIDFHNLFL